MRGVRIGSRELQQLAKFVTSDGQLFLFRSGTSEDLPAELPLPLERRAEQPLVDSLGSRLAVLGKTPQKTE